MFKKLRRGIDSLFDTAQSIGATVPARPSASVTPDYSISSGGGDGSFSGSEAGVISSSLTPPPSPPPAPAAAPVMLGYDDTGAPIYNAPRQSLVERLQSKKPAPSPAPTPVRYASPAGWGEPERWGSWYKTANNDWSGWSPVEALWGQALPKFGFKGAVFDYYGPDEYGGAGGQSLTPAAAKEVARLQSLGYDFLSRGGTHNLYLASLTPQGAYQLNQKGESDFADLAKGLSFIAPFVAGPLGGALAGALGGGAAASVLAPAIVSGGLGGLSSVAQGGDFGAGFGKGALTGGLTAGIGSLVTPVASSIGSSVLDATKSQALADLASGAIKGGAGALPSAIVSGDASKLLTGALSGGIGAGVKTAVGDLLPESITGNQPLDTALTKGATDLAVAAARSAVTGQDVDVAKTLMPAVAGGIANEFGVDYNTALTGLNVANKLISGGSLGVGDVLGVGKALSKESSSAGYGGADSGDFFDSEEAQAVQDDIGSLLARYPTAESQPVTNMVEASTDPVERLNMSDWDSYFNEMAQMEQLNLDQTYPDNWNSYFDETAQLENLAYPSDVGDFGPPLYTGPSGGSTTQTPSVPSIGSVGSALSRLFGSGGAQNLLTQGANLATSKGGIAAILALLSMLDRQKPSGGGTKMAYQGPRQYTRTVAPGATGTPIARYAANGGLMQAYAGGGHVQMEDGGFVMTKRAVDGAGGPRGIQQLVPGARPIRGPGTGTSDSIPATIQGPRGSTPAKVSNGEAYVPRAAVQQAGGPKRMYALMNRLQRKA